MKDCDEFDDYCPNCLAIWGFAEIERQHCFACGYSIEDRMINVDDDDDFGIPTVTESELEAMAKDPDIQWELQTVHDEELGRANRATVTSSAWANTPGELAEWVRRVETLEAENVALKERAAWAESEAMSPEMDAIWEAVRPEGDTGEYDYPAQVTRWVRQRMEELAALKREAG